jgi:hypothetical protein
LRPALLPAWEQDYARRNERSLNGKRQKMPAN